MAGRRKSAARVLLEGEQERIVSRYRDGRETVQQIADSYRQVGGTYGLVRMVLLDAGVRLETGRRRFVDDHAAGDGDGGPVSRVFRPSVTIPPMHGDLVTLAELREIAGLTLDELARSIDVSYPRVVQIDKTPVSGLMLSTIARQVEGCGAHLKLVAEFDDDDAFVLYDSTGVDYTGGQYAPPVNGAAGEARDKFRRGRGDT